MHKSAYINFLHATQLFDKPNTPFSLSCYVITFVQKMSKNSITLIELRHKRLTFFQTAYCKNKESVEILFLDWYTHNLTNTLLLPTHPIQVLHESIINSTTCSCFYCHQTYFDRWWLVISCRLCYVRPIISLYFERPHKCFSIEWLHLI